MHSERRESFTEDLPSFYVPEKGASAFLQINDTFGGFPLTLLFLSVIIAVLKLCTLQERNRFSKRAENYGNDETGSKRTGVYSSF